MDLNGWDVIWVGGLVMSVWMGEAGGMTGADGWKVGGLCSQANEGGWGRSRGRYGLKFGRKVLSDVDTSLKLNYFEKKREWIRVNFFSISFRNDERFWWQTHDTLCQPNSHLTTELTTLQTLRVPLVL